MTAVPTLESMLAAETEVEVGGETFKLHKATLDEQKAFSKHLKDRARREAVVTDPDMPDEDRDRLARMALRDVAEGYYDPLSPGYVAAQQTPEGMAEFIFCVLRTNHPTITRARVRELIEAGIAQKFLEVVRMEEPDADPKVLGDLCVALGFPRNFLSPSESSSSASVTRPTTGSPGKSDDSTPTS